VGELGFTIGFLFQLHGIPLILKKLCERAMEHGIDDELCNDEVRSTHCMFVISFV
jgi:hypothetical protein